MQHILVTECNSPVKRLDPITYLFDSKAKDLSFFCLFLQVFLESGSESFNSIFLNFFFFFAIKSDRRRFAYYTFQLFDISAFLFTQSSKLL